ncbi:MAG: hypothetical protein K0S11_1577 [Gammaproteobacteria bacterium]|jgi:hypothetical protein|nr:hypothetical protein [Gammaproteobacteria bacterium]
MSFTDYLCCFWGKPGKKQESSYLLEQKDKSKRVEDKEPSSPETPHKKQERYQDSSSMHTPSAIFAGKGTPNTGDSVLSFGSTDSKGSPPLFVKGEGADFIAKNLLDTNFRYDL